MDDGKDERIMVKWMNKGYVALHLDVIISQLSKPTLKRFELIGHHLF